MTLQFTPITYVMRVAFFWDYRRVLVANMSINRPKVSVCETIEFEKFFVMKTGGDCS